MVGNQSGTRAVVWGWRMTQLLVERALFIVAILSAIPLLCSAVASGLVVVLQTLVQVQEQTMVHLTRVGVGLGVVALLMPWANSLLVELLQEAFEAMERLGGIG